MEISKECPMCTDTMGGLQGVSNVVSLADYRASRARSETFNLDFIVLLLLILILFLALKKG